MLKELKDLVGTTNSAVNSRDIYGYPKTSNYTDSSGQTHLRTIDPIITKITELLKPEDDINKIPYQALTNFKKELVYRYVIFQDPYENFLPIVETLYDSQRELVTSGLKSFNYTNEWKQAIALIKELLESGSYSFTKIKPYLLRNTYPKEFDTASSVLALKKKYSWKIVINNDGDIHISSGVEKTTKALEKLIKQIGGLELIEFIFDYLRKHNLYNDTVKRYLIGRNTTMLALDRIPDTPLGYLLNIAVKYPYKKNDTSNTIDIINEILTTSTQLCNALFQAQHYSIWEIIFGGGSSIIDLVKDISIYDTIYSFEQGDIDSERKTLKEILSFISDDDFYKLCGFNFNSFFDLLSELSEISFDVHDPIILRKSVLNKKLRLQKKELEALFDTISHNSDEINSKYELPSEYSAINFWKKPLIKINSNTYLFVNKILCAKAFYESVATKLRVSKNFDSNVGYELERYLKNLLNKKEITFSCGEYNEEGVFGECDLVIETDEKIALFEIKKKVLTGRAKSGNDIDIIVDLNKSLVASQIQASRTKLLLLKNHCITLYNKVDNTTYELKLNNRRIELISVTHLDYRGFHDRLFITSFLNTFLTHEINTFSTDDKTKKKFDELKENASILIDQYNSFLTFNPSHAKVPYFDSSFFNIDHLLLVLNLSDDNSSFLKLLTSTKNINTTGSLNFYKEFCNSHDMTRVK